MRRREFIAGVAGVATLPIAAHAQQLQTKRVGVIMGWSESDPELRADLATFFLELARLGWVEGRNLHVERRWTNGEFVRIAPLAKELVALQPDVILSGTTPVTAALHRETRTIPIVFAVVSDPVGDGFVASLARPGGNITGFINVEGTLGGKWLQLLKEIAPSIKRAAIMFNPDTAPGNGRYFLPSFEAAARILAVDPVITPVRSDAEIENAIIGLGRERAGLVMMTDVFMAVHRGSVISAAARNNVPAIFETSFAREGGLMSYGAIFSDIFRRSASHVDRILRGMKPADLPVEVPVRFALVINLKTAKTLGLTVPPTLLAIADEVIE